MVRKVAVYKITENTITCKKFFLYKYEIRGLEYVVFY